MAIVMLKLSRDEIQKEIPYAAICEARYGARWSAARRKRRWKQEFTDAEKEKAARLFSLSHTWYLVKGVPEKVTMSISTYAFWQKLGDFCASI